MIEAQPRRRRRGCLWVLIVVLLAGAVLVVAVGAGIFLLTRPNPGNGTLTGVQGTVEMRPEASTAWAPAIENQSVGSDERVRTGAGSTVNILFFERAIVGLDQNTEIGLQDISATRRGQSGSVTYFNWAGTTNVRMVPLKDARAVFTVETPVSTTTMSGAEVTIAVGPDGTTTVTPSIGSAEVTGKAAAATEGPGRVHGLARMAAIPVLQGSAITVFAGQQAVIDVNGAVTVNPVYSVSPEALNTLLGGSLNTSGNEWSLTLSEQEVNDALALAGTSLQDYGVSVPTVWFTNGSIVMGGIVNGSSFGVPLSGPFTVVATPSVDAEGNIKLSVTEANVAGVPLPANVASEAVALAESTIRNYVTIPGTPVKITSVVVGEGTLTIGGTKI